MRTTTSPSPSRRENWWHACVPSCAAARGLLANPPWHLQCTAWHRILAIWALDEERHQIRFYGKALELSRYEYGVLRLLVQKPGRVFTRDELLLKVWGDANDSFDRTVDAHIKTLRAKLKLVAPGLEPIRTLRGSGYALSEELPGAL